MNQNYELISSKLQDLIEAEDKLGFAQTKAEEIPSLMVLVEVAKAAFVDAVTPIVGQDPVTEPDPVEPDPVEPDPVEPDPVEPDPVEPDPVEPDPPVMGPAFGIANRGYMADDGLTYDSEDRPSLIRPIHRTPKGNEELRDHIWPSFQQADAFHTDQNHVYNGDGSLSYWADLPTKTVCGYKDRFLRSLGVRNRRYVALVKMPQKRYSGVINAPLWIYSETDPVFGKAEVDFEIVKSGLQINVHYPKVGGGKTHGTFFVTDEIFNSYGNEVEYLIEVRPNDDIYCRVYDNTRGVLILEQLLTPQGLKNAFPDLDVNVWNNVLWFPYWAYFFLQDNPNWSGALESEGRPTNILLGLGVFPT